jgi:ketosteroid isomerase-like protein
VTTAIGTQTEANRETIREAFEAWKNGTAFITDVFAPEMVWRIEGHSVASKRYDSKQQFIDGTAFYDSISFNELWSRVQPR